MLKLLTSILLISCFSGRPVAQQHNFFFKKIAVTDGLDDGNILAITQDSKGFMWFSTKSGLNRYDGYSIKQYNYIAGDPTSLPASIVRCMAPDKEGNFWVGQENDLLKYNPQSDIFERVPALKNTWIKKIIPVNQETIFLLTHRGLAAFNKQTGKAVFYTAQQDSLFNYRIFDMAWTNNQLYLAGENGLLSFKNNRLNKLSNVVANDYINAIAADDKNNLWLAVNNRNELICYNTINQSTATFNQSLDQGYNTIANFSSLITDKKGRLWITTNLEGLLVLNKNTKKLDKILQDPLKIWTPSTNLHHTAYCDKDGNIWIGGNNGINYFNPDKNLFEIIPVFDKEPDIRNRRVARVAVQDKNNQLWFGTIDGLVKYDSAKKQYREWNNRPGLPEQLHYNSVRGLLCDDDNNIWIATGRGINLFKQKENKMIFFTGKDSIPAGFYFSADKDRNGNFWFASRDGDGFYYYNTTDKKFRSIKNFPGLEKYAGYGSRKLLHDSKGRYWLGFNGAGIAMYNPTNQQHKQWQAGNDTTQNIAGNIVVDIREDKKGIIWISTFTGLSAIDPANYSIKNYSNTNGLINNSTSALAIDNNDRLWIGTGSGLMMLDSSRNYFTSFGLADGLPSVEFPEHAASVLNNGDFMFPTQNGFIRFAAGNFKKEQHYLEPYFTSFNISGKKRVKISGNNIQLRHDENFFSIGFGAINYNNAAENWYAYKLDGIDTDWKYTQNRFVDYTGIAGGEYTFRVKASAGREEWNGPETILQIHIDTIFYRTVWFRSIIVVLLLAGLYAIYRYRIRQKEKMLYLQSKTQLLEKEKALAMYESLKQQLNPHFLFNSLSSLSGLIEADQQMAGNFLEQMSGIYRYILKNRDSELVTLKEELDFMQAYINLQKTRFGNGLQLNINISPTVMKDKIAPVTLQNLLENAIKHNIVDTDSPLLVEINAHNGYLQVKNNLQKKKMIETSNKQGIASLKNLYKYLSKKPVLIEETNHYFSISIPLIEASL